MLPIGIFCLCFVKILLLNNCEISSLSLTLRLKLTVSSYSHFQENGDSVVDHDQELVCHFKKLPPEVIFYLRAEFGDSDTNSVIIL